MAAVEGYSNLLAWAPTLASILGWFLVNYQNNKREQRKEMRAAADRCKALVTDVGELGIKYWLGQQPAESWHIKAQLDQLDVEIKCFPLYRNQSPLVSALIRLIDSITDGNFESSSMTAKAPADERIATIRIARNLMLLEIEHQFKVHFT